MFLSLSDVKKPMESNNKKAFNLSNWLVYFVLAALMILFTVATDGTFLNAGNLAAIGRQTAMVSIIAFGATFVITTGNIDLSCGAILGLTGLMVASLLQAGVPMILASVLGLGLGALVGVGNGLLVAKVKIPSFLATLGTMSICRGLALTVTNTKSIIILDKGENFFSNFVQFWGASDIGGVPTAIIWTLITFVICFWLYHYTVFGNHVKAIGGNITAAKYSGVKVEKVTMIVFVIAGILAAVAGLIMAARLKNGRPEVGEGMELDAIAAVVLGGTVMSGGKGNMLNTLVGSLVLGVVLNGLIFAGFQQNVQQIVKGIIIIVSVAASSRTKS